MLLCFWLGLDPRIGRWRSGPWSAHLGSKVPTPAGNMALRPRKLGIPLQQLSGAIKRGLLFATPLPRRILSGLKGAVPYLLRLDCDGTRAPSAACGISCFTGRFSEGLLRVLEEGRATSSDCARKSTTVSWGMPSPGYPVRQVDLKLSISCNKPPYPLSDSSSMALGYYVFQPLNSNILYLKQKGSLCICMHVY